MKDISYQQGINLWNKNNALNHINLTVCKRFKRFKWIYAIILRMDCPRIFRVHILYALFQNNFFFRFALLTKRFRMLMSHVKAPRRICDRWLDGEKGHRARFQVIEKIMFALSGAHTRSSACLCGGWIHGGPRFCFGNKTGPRLDSRSAGSCGVGERLPSSALGLTADLIIIGHCY